MCRNASLRDLQQVTTCIGPLHNMVKTNMISGRELNRSVSVIEAHRNVAMKSSQLLSVSSTEILSFFCYLLCCLIVLCCCVVCCIVGMLSVRSFVLLACAVSGLCCSHVVCVLCCLVYLCCPCCLCVLLFICVACI